MAEDTGLCDTFGKVVFRLYMYMKDNYLVISLCIH